MHRLSPYNIVNHYFTIRRSQTRELPGLRQVTRLFLAKETSREVETEVIENNTSVVAANVNSPVKNELPASIKLDFHLIEGLPAAG